MPTRKPPSRILRTRGSRTSEFATTALLVVAVLALALANKIDGNAALAAITAAVGTFTISRGIAKRGTSADEL